MGNFYVNHTVRAPQDRVVAVLQAEDRIAFVSPTVDGYTIVCDQECDSQDETAIVRLGRRLSARLDSPVLAVLNHDDDILCYWLFEHGKVTEEFNSCPEYFDDEDEYSGFSIYAGDEDEDELRNDTEPLTQAPTPGAALCRAFGKLGLEAEVAAILKSHEMFALFTHKKLIHALGLPEGAVATGYRYVAEGDGEIDPDDCIHVGGHAPASLGWEDDEE